MPSATVASPGSSPPTEATIGYGARTPAWFGYGLGMTPMVLTIGHSNRRFEELLRMLRANHATQLVDVRTYPSSRSFPQWNEPAIRDALPEDVAYRRIPELGGRRHTPAGVPSENGGWRVKAFQDYADHMASDEFARGLAELVELAHRGVPVIMCSEAVPWRCHRRLITDALIVAGVEVGHIMSATSTRPARLSEHAVVRTGRIIYPPGADQGEDLLSRVRAVVESIPVGRVATYGDVAEVVGTGARQVGALMSDLDDAAPWWRVVRADGTPPTCHGGGALERLAAEETPMKRTRVDVQRARHHW